jgi:CDP-paratose 2-epimerase
MRILITGGAGFVGSNLALNFRHKIYQSDVVVFDNLKRRGSELNIPKFKRSGIHFVHGDIRNQNDLDDIPGNFDVMIDASAEPSVHSGQNGSPLYPIQTNLSGTVSCLEFARRRVGQLVFLSTSRVYSIQPLREIHLQETSTRFELQDNQTRAGLTTKGISETFPTNQARSLYGACKLASEMLIQEYIEAYDLKAHINRCGVIAGPGQFGKVDQGVFTLWVANHYFKKKLTYTGFGGQGFQVRDLLHPDDLFDLIQLQIQEPNRYRGEVFNVGGGMEVSTSLFEFTQLCQQVTGQTIPIMSQPESAAVDIPFYVSDTSKVSEAYNWRPKKSVLDIVKDIKGWIDEDRDLLAGIFN